MPRHGVVTISDQNFDVVKEYLNTGHSKAMTEETQRMLNICIEVYGMLKKFPQRNICIKRTMVQFDMSYKQAAQYVDFARSTWCNYVDLKRDFLETFFLEKLLAEISNPDNSEQSRAKNLATLQKHLEAMPEQKVDPRVMESNQIFIQVNIGGRATTLSEEDLELIPMQVRQKLLASMGGAIDDQEAVRLLES